jgi:hypothetical protein
MIAGEDPTVGILLGAMGASAIDALRAYDDPKRKLSATPRPTLQVAPLVGRKIGGLTLGGVF